MAFILNRRVRDISEPQAPDSSQNVQELLSAQELLSSADASRDDRRWQDAATLYRQYLMQRPEDAPIWVQLGHALKESGNLGEAESAYKRSLALAPDVADTQLQLGHLYKMMRNFSDAIAAYREAARLDQELLSSADASRDDRRWQDAATLYRQYLMLRPEDAPIWVQLGHALKESGNLGEAESAYKRSLALAPNVADTQLQLGHLHKMMRNFSDAIAAYREAAQLDDTLVDARQELAEFGIDTLTASSPGMSLLCIEQFRAATAEAHTVPLPEEICSSERAPYRYPALLPLIFRALADPNGYDVGLRRLDEDLRKKGPSQLARFYYEEILRRSPETAAVARELVKIPSRRIREMISTDEFMSRHDVVLQQEFSHLSRECFFHAPKSGGTTLFYAFASDSRFCPLYLFPGFDNGWFPVRLDYLRDAILRLTNPQAQHIILFGHPRAPRILRNNLKRGWDNAFTILRDPIDTCLSYINYVLTELRRIPDHPEVITWRNMLGLRDKPFVPDHRAVLNLVPKILKNIVPSNPMCTILGSAPCLESVLDTAEILDLKIIRFEQIDDYIRSRGIISYERMNVSTKYVHYSDLSRRIQRIIYHKNAGDVKFYNWAERHMSPGNGPWFELFSS